MEGRTLMWTQGDPYLPAPTGEEEDCRAFALRRFPNDFRPWGRGV